MTSDGLRVTGQKFYCLKCDQEVAWNSITNKPKGHVALPDDCANSRTPCKFNTAGLSGKRKYFGQEAVDRHRRLFLEAVRRSRQRKKDRKAKSLAFFAKMKASRPEPKRRYKKKKK